MADYAHAFAAAAVKASEHAYGTLERFAAESAEAFVDKQYIGRKRRAGIGQSKCEGERCHETFAAGDSGDRALVVSVEGISHKNYELAVATAETIAVGQFRQIVVGVVEERFQHETLGDTVEFVARCRAYQFVEPAPFHPYFAGCIGLCD